MTAIVGLVQDGDVYLGGDSAGVDTGRLGLQLRADQKVFRKGEMVFGFTSSFRMGQLIRYKLELPEQRVSQHDPFEFLAGEFVDALRKCLKDGGFVKKKDEVESGGTFLVGYRQRLFAIGDDFQVAETVHGFDAVGCGDFFALGSFYSTERAQPLDRIKAALGAAAEFSAGVRAPFHIEVLQRETGSAR